MGRFNGGIWPATASMRQQALSEWLLSSSGAATLAAERALIGAELGCVFGFYGVEVGVNLDFNLLESAQTRHCYQFCPGNGRADVPVRFDLSYWPFELASLDLVVLHHVMDIASHPQRLLSEAAGTVVSGGKVIVIGANPGFVGRWIERLVPGYRSPFGQLSAISPARLSDWLSLLGFRVDRLAYSKSRWPEKRRQGQAGRSALQPWLKRCTQTVYSPLSAAYMLVATREEAGMTPLRPFSRRAASPIIVPPVAS